MSDDIKKKSFTISLDERELEALDVLSSREPIASLDLDRRRLIKFALLTASQEQTKPVLYATHEDVEGIRSELKALNSILANAFTIAQTVQSKRAPKAQEVEPEIERAPVGRPPKEDKNSRATEICEALGGSISGGTCHYIKYEVTAAGRAVSWQVGEPVGSLTDSTIASQYSPSLEDWIRTRELEATTPAADLASAEDAGTST